MERAASASLTGLAALLVTVSAALAQKADLLDEVERLANRGEILAARDLLSRWERDRLPAASSEEVARSWFLKGRLQDDAEEAELLYLRVVIEGSSSGYADDALFRLAQYKFAGGDFARAIEYLGRLRRDYPTSEHGPGALLWIAKSSRARGDAERACAAAEQGLREVAPTDTALFRALQEARAGCRETTGRYSVQVAAFKDAVAAQRLAQRLLDSGYDAWILNATRDDPLHRVRVGRRLGEAEAQGLLDRLVADGFSPFLVAGPALEGDR